MVGGDIMAHNYEEFPFRDFKHAIKEGKNTYRNKFFHDIDLGFLLKWMESIEGENYTIKIEGFSDEGVSICKQIIVKL